MSNEEKKEKKYIDILGQSYEVVTEKEGGRCDKLNANGLCEPYKKQIILLDFEPDERTVLSPHIYKEKVFRHEIIHAFLFESGLDDSSWPSEEIVDWIALQLPKMVRLMMKLDILR